MHTRKNRNAGAAVLAALLLGTVPAIAQNAGGAAGGVGAASGVGGAGGPGAAGGVGGANGGAPGNASTAGMGAAAGGVGAIGNGAGGVSGSATGTVGGNANGAANGTAGVGAAGVSGNNGVGTGAVNGSTGTGVNGALSNGGTPGGSLPISGSPAPQHYDVARTIADALKASADVQTVTRDIRIDQARADQAAARGRPNVAAEGQATRFDQATKVSIGNSPPIQVLPSHTELLQLNLSDQLDITGQIRAASDQYRLQSLADQFALQQVADARILRAQTVYFDLLQTYHQVQVAQANLANAQQNLTDAQNQNAAGTGLKLDLLRAQTQVAQDQQQLTQAQNNYHVAESTFNDLVGRPLDTPITLDDVPGVTVGAPVTNTAAVGAPTMQTLFAPPDVSGINLNQSLQTAFTHRPEILADQVNVRSAAIGITLARAGLQPTLRLDASGNYYPTTSFQDPRQRTAQITATLVIPIYDGNATHDLVREARLQQENAQTTLASQRSDVALDVNQAYLNLVTAAQQITSANTALQTAIAARQNAEIRYRGGVGLFLEVTDAQAALVQAQNSQINAVYNYLVARAQFENAIGTPQTQ